MASTHKGLYTCLTKDCQTLQRFESEVTQRGPEKANSFRNLIPFGLDTEERQLLREEKPVPLTPKAYEPLRILVQNGGESVARKSSCTGSGPTREIRETQSALWARCGHNGGDGSANIPSQQWRRKERRSQRFQ